ncbi:hypothetical protein AAFF_G00201540 [Aldrovandia affinis]|uniref:Uncharacterized protein n=1 Tax=Aldrovandia affinis TaxID=143900 RepID=A0AAD7WV48_9TELE|nr:hypothetical protein AAFF_G00201540 [Aldrovandia affinis]
MNKGARAYMLLRVCAMRDIQLRKCAVRDAARKSSSSLHPVARGRPRIRKTSPPMCSAAGRVDRMAEKCSGKRPPHPSTREASITDPQPPFGRQLLPTDFHHANPEDSQR